MIGNDHQAAPYGDFHKIGNKVSAKTRILCVLLYALPTKNDLFLAQPLLIGAFPNYIKPQMLSVSSYANAWLNACVVHTLG